MMIGSQMGVKCQVLNVVQGSRQLQISTKMAQDSD